MVSCSCKKIIYIYIYIYLYVSIKNIIMFFFQIMLDEEVEGQDSLIDKIVSFPGPVCTVSNLRACASSETRVEWSPAVVKDAMSDLARAGIGETVTLERTVDFVKNPPDHVTDTALSQNTTLSKEQHKEWFLFQDMNLSNSKKDGLIAKARLSREIQGYLTQNKEN